MKKLFYLFLLSSFFVKAERKPIFDDKFKHNIAGIGSAIIVSEIVYQTTNLDGLSPLVGFSFGVTITLGKEYFYDRYLGYGVFSKGDIIAGCMGSLTGAMIHRIIIDLRYKKEQKRLIKLQNSKRILD